MSKDEYKSLKNKYTEDADALITANMKLEKEIETVLACKHDRLMWMEHFKRFGGLTEIDRRTVVNLIQNIKIESKTDILITFNYQSEYENALAILRKEGA